MLQIPRRGACTLSACWKACTMLVSIWALCSPRTAGCASAAVRLRAAAQQPATPYNTKFYPALPYVPHRDSLPSTKLALDKGCSGAGGSGTCKHQRSFNTISNSAECRAAALDQSAELAEGWEAGSNRYPPSKFCTFSHCAMKSKILLAQRPRQTDGQSFMSVLGPAQMRGLPGLGLWFAHPEGMQRGGMWRSSTAKRALVWFITGAMCSLPMYHRDIQERQERVCQGWDSVALGDERHVLLGCSVL